MAWLEATTIPAAARISGQWTRGCPPVNPDTCLHLQDHMKLYSIQTEIILPYKMLSNERHKKSQCVHVLTVNTNYGDQFLFAFLLFQAANVSLLM